MTGTIKNTNTDKGFGFIKDAHGNEYFFHRSAVLRPATFDQLRKGDTVEFEDCQSDRGLRAEDVRLV